MVYLIENSLLLEIFCFLSNVIFISVDEKSKKHLQTQNEIL